MNSPSATCLTLARFVKHRLAGAGVVVAGVMAALGGESHGAVTLVPTHTELVFDGLQGAVIDPASGFISISDDGFRYIKVNSGDTSVVYGLTSFAEDAGYHSSTAYWVQEGSSISLTDLASGGSFGGFTAPCFGVGDTIAGYVVSGNSLTNTIELRGVGSLSTVAYALAIDPDIVAAASGNFTGLGTYLGVGGNAANPFDYVVGITAANGSIYEMTLGDMGNWREVVGLQPDLQDIAYGDGVFLGVTDLNNLGLAGDVQTGNYTNRMAAVPEPAAFGLLGLGLAGSLLRRRRGA